LGMSDKNCFNCNYSNLFEVYDYSYSATCECRRFPPSMLDEHADIINDEESYYDRFPLVSSRFHWCGEWKPKKGEN
jgi:hypothetical protein